MGAKCGKVAKSPEQEEVDDEAASNTNDQAEGHVARSQGKGSVD